MANNWLKRSAGWVIGLKNKPAPDLFTVARIKIAFWYALVGLVILAVGAYLVYAYILFIIGDIIRIIQALLQSRVVSQSTGTTLITQSINSDLTKMSIAVGIWIVFTMVLSAYVLAEIILWPIRRAMERQRRFIANVSHELRTPLSVMRMNADVALMSTADVAPDELLATIRSNRDEVDRMAKITQFLLNFSNVENRMATSKLSRVDLAKVIAGAVDSTKPLAAEKGVSMNFAASTVSAVVKGNSTALGEMTTNLLKNAIAYTPAGGTVSVTVFRKGGSLRADAVVLSVADTGIGIPPEDLPNIFEAFYRGRNAVKEHKDTNSGLGLAIAKEIATFHGATISAKSEVGKGTVVSIRFPTIS